MTETTGSHDLKPAELTKVPRQPISIQPYLGAQSEEALFDNNLEENRYNRKYVGQGHARVSLEGIPLVTEGLFKCTAGLVRNTDTGVSALVHFEPHIESAFRLQSELSNLGDGERKALIFKGTHGLAHEAEGVLNFLGILVVDIVPIETGEVGWAIAYIPKNDKVIIDQKSAKNSLTYEGFNAPS